MKVILSSIVILLLSNVANGQNKVSGHSGTKNVKVKAQNLPPQMKYMKRLNSKEAPTKIFYYNATKTYKKCANDPLPPRPLPKGYGLSKLKCTCNGVEPGIDVSYMYVSPEVIRKYLNKTYDSEVVCANSTIYIGGKSNFVLRIDADSIASTDALITSFALKAKNTKVSSFGNITFKPNSSTITLQSYPVLDETAKALSTSPYQIIELDGFTADDEGTAARTSFLSKDRANSVKYYLMGSGLDAKRLKIKGWGENHPIGDNTTEQGRILNRRVEFKKVPGG